MDVTNKWRVVINIFVINVIVLCLNVTLFAFSALTLLVGRQEVHPAWKKTEWCGAGVVVCLEQGAVLPMAQLMPLTLTVSCFSKIQTGLPFWYWLTRVVPDKRPLNGCVFVTHCFTLLALSSTTPVVRSLGHGRSHQPSTSTAGTCSFSVSMRNCFVPFSGKFLQLLCAENQLQDMFAVHCVIKTNAVRYTIRDAISTCA